MTDKESMCRKTRHTALLPYRMLSWHSPVISGLELSPITHATPSAGGGIIMTINKPLLARSWLPGDYYQASEPLRTLASRQPTLHHGLYIITSPPAVHRTTTESAR